VFRVQGGTKLSLFAVHTSLWIDAHFMAAHHAWVPVCLSHVVHVCVSVACTAWNPLFNGRAALEAKRVEAARISQEVVEDLLERTRKVGQNRGGRAALTGCVGSSY
jgi:hypothetical protein